MLKISFHTLSATDTMYSALGRGHRGIERRMLILYSSVGTTRSGIWRAGLWDFIISVLALALVGFVLFHAQGSLPPPADRTRRLRRRK
jgi:hypothetical protein